MGISAGRSGGEQQGADEECREEAAACCEGDEPSQEPGSEGSTLHRHEFDVNDRPDGQEGQLSGGGEARQGDGHEGVGLRTQCDDDGQQAQHSSLEQDIAR
ncbi:MAG: hypothetical protein KH757_11700, partial [Megasphaera sp.]|nr:hypothetical protein [Megasphaera sp.]